jgi:hypothetical protein
MATTGTFTAGGGANQVSNTLRLLPQETLTFVLSGAGGYIFEGTAALEVSRDDRGSWQVAKNTSGTALSYAGAQAADLAVSTTVKNETNKPEYYRVRAATVEIASNDMVFTLTEGSDDVVEAVLRDGQGRILISALDNGGIRVAGKLEVAGALEAESASSTIVAASIALATGVTEYVAAGTISAAAVVSTAAGDFGHASGVPLITVATGYCLEFVSLVAIFDRITAAYANGGNITVNVTGGAAITGLVSAANSLGAAADAQYVFYPLTTAAVAAAAATGVSLVSSAAFTVASSSAGVIRWKLRYRLVLIA